MGIKKIIFNIIFIVFIVQTISALTIDIQIPDSFSQGEQIYFNYIITSDTTQEVTFIPRVSCPNAPVSLIQEERISLPPNLSYISTYHDLTIDNSIEPQTCTAYVQILEPIQLIEEKNFSIITDPSFSFNIKLNKKVFLKNENIYLDYDSEVENPFITAILTYPDKTTESINLPTSIKPSQIGTYELDVTASKEGYKTVNLKEQFGVIKKPAEIKEIEKPDLEDFKTKTSIKKSNIVIVLVLLGILIIIVLIVYFIYRKNNRNKI